jgi:hypothetical protein
MRPETKDILHDARSLLGNAAGRIAGRETAAYSLTTHEREVVIGFGTSRDWIRWAMALVDLTFRTRAEQRSARGEGITESVRFNQMWTATNALYARDGVLRLIVPMAKLPTTDLDQFKLLYKAASPDAKLETSCISTLHRLLDMECATTGITPILGTANPTMWEVIYHKYCRPKDRTRGIGKVIGNALAKKQFPRPDGPTLIYGARNWAVHGMLLTSFFRGSRQKYLTFIDNITLLLAATLRGAAQHFDKQI